ncbi:hypothetical protein I79_008049 [Cricetulus griseus]|uniref:Uncharacterized protein n=1 Tax=Cricetulus griseus TaxID=10029 RepID=G3HC08_CRIGR|nr:hypothetical protein I79_008049 [Cricetulus griseus]
MPLCVCSKESLELWREVRGDFTEDLTLDELGCWMTLSLSTPQSHLPEITGSQGR